MTFEGWDEINPYDYIINNDLSFTVTYNGEAIHTSRPFRLKAQAKRKAVDFIYKHAGVERRGDTTLDVQGMSIDAEAIFNRS
jgi:hypothetical protein